MKFLKDVVVLIAEDDSSMRKTIADILSTAGYNTFLHAADGVEAVMQLEWNPVDLLILDWRMPKKSGLHVLQWARANKDYESLPILMITAEAEAEKVKTAVIAGVTGYIIKPFSPKTLLK